MLDYGESKVKEYSKFFNKIFWLSCVLILFGFLINAEINSATFTGKTYLLVLVELIKSIGIALLVANFFSFIIGTKDFVEFIKNKLQEVVISNDFVKDLDHKGKVKLAKLILGPKTEISKIYNGIEKYFDSYLNDSFKLFTLIFRGKVSINVKAKVGSDNIVFFDEELEYRSFRVDQKMARLRHSFEDNRSKHIKTTITTPDGDTYELADTDEHDDTNSEDASMAVKKIQSIPDEFVKHDYLDIERHFHEFGEDHLGVFSYKATQPSDGLTIRFECYDDLIIKYVNTYGASSNFSIEPNSPINKTEVVITCKKWLSPGFGVMVIVSKKQNQ
ncbi:MAG: hypothetical protein GY827_09380 [Cytophagales bacterium]|nr:hypothetical protein [Cytophagales bacterium]